DDQLEKAGAHLTAPEKAAVIDFNARWIDNQQHFPPLIRLDQPVHGLSDFPDLRAALVKPHVDRVQAIPFYRSEEYRRCLLERLDHKLVSAQTGLLFTNPAKGGVSHDWGANDPGTNRLGFATNILPEDRVFEVLGDGILRALQGTVVERGKPLSPLKK